MKVKNLLPALDRRNREVTDHPFYTLQKEMNSLFDDFFQGFDIAQKSFNTGALKSFNPSLDVRETEKEFVIKAELPGVDEKDVEVTVTDDAVTIKGEKKEEKEDKGKNYYYMERSYGSFHRTIPLASGAESGKAEASFKNGILSIKVPKSESAKTKGTKVPIKST